MTDQNSKEGRPQRNSPLSGQSHFCMDQAGTETSDIGCALGLKVQLLCSLQAPAAIAKRVTGVHLIILQLQPQIVILAPIHMLHHLRFTGLLQAKLSETLQIPRSRVQSKPRAFRSCDRHSLLWKDSPQKYWWTRRFRVVKASRVCTASILRHVPTVEQEQDAIRHPKKESRPRAH